MIVRAAGFDATRQGMQRDVGDQVLSSVQLPSFAARVNWQSETPGSRCSRSDHSSHVSHETQMRVSAMANSPLCLVPLTVPMRDCGGISRAYCRAVSASISLRSFGWRARRSPAVR